MFGFNKNNFTGEKRIKKFLTIYKNAKSRFPELNEREMLYVVTGEFRPPSFSGRSYSDMRFSPEEYIEDVFKNKEISIEDLVFHFITSEFPDEYKVDFSYLDIEANNPSQREVLRDRIQVIKEEILD